MTFSIQPTHVRVTQQALSTWVLYLSEHVILNVTACQNRKEKNYLKNNPIQLL